MAKCVDADDCDFVVRIKAVDTSGLPKIGVRPNADVAGNLNIGSGTNNGGAQIGTEVKFVLTHNVFKDFSFVTVGTPICVLPANTTAKDCPSAPNLQFPSTEWSVTAATPRKVVLHVPPLTNGNDYKYFLILNGPGTPASRVVIDPKMGCCLADSKIIPWLNSKPLSPDAVFAISLAGAAIAGMIVARFVWPK